MIKAGAFGGTYFRDITSFGKHVNAWKEFQSWFSGVNIKNKVARPFSDYSTDVNKYKVKCGQTLEQWLNAKWIKKQDPYGWLETKIERAIQTLISD